MAPNFSLPLIRVLCWPSLAAEARNVLAGSSTASFEVADVVDAAEALQRLRRDVVDVAVLSPAMVTDPSLATELATRIAIVLQADAVPPPADWMAALELGVQDCLIPADWSLPSAALRVHGAALRHRLARDARTAYATDLATGLPHQQQLIEHMSHLLALREREPAPMALLVLRIEGLATTGARLGVEAASALRRKLAVRLRSGLRASDVVAAIGSDSFAVLLAWIDAAADVDGVAAKLVRSVQRPFSLSGQAVALAASVGVARFPEDGKEAGALLQVALAQAAGEHGQGRVGFANHAERGPATAANDDNA